MSMSNAAEQAFLDHYFLNLDHAGVGDAGGLRGSVVAGSIYVALHTADPGEAGTASTNEVAYSGYARVAIARSGAGFSRSGSVVSNAALVQFPERLDVGTTTATHFSFVLASSGAAQILLSGALSASRDITQGNQPQFAIGALQATAD